MKEMICIVCPKGCRLTVDEENGYRVTGNGCERGVEYGVNEARNPVRVITSTVVIEGAPLRRCPVKLSAAIPKGQIFDAMCALEGVVLKAPVKRGQVVVENVCDSGANFVATRDL